MMDELSIINCSHLICVPGKKGGWDIYSGTFFFSFRKPYIVIDYVPKYKD